MPKSRLSTVRKIELSKNLAALFSAKPIVAHLRDSTAPATESVALFLALRLLDRLLGLRRSRAMRSMAHPGGRLHQRFKPLPCVGFKFDVRLLGGGLGHG